jgi:nitrogen fixation protein NifQ
MSPLGDAAGPRGLYVELAAHGAGDAFDRHVFACALTVGAGETDRSLTEALGLTARSLRQLINAYFPTGGGRLLAALPPGADPGADALEEPDLRQLLLDHRSRGVIEEEWLAAIIARRSLCPDHLWQDLGLFNRSDLGRLLRRHFEPLAQRNVRDIAQRACRVAGLDGRYGILTRANRTKEISGMGRVGIGKVRARVQVRIVRFEL